MSVNPMIKDRVVGSPPAGERTGAWLRTLDLGATVLETTAPLRDFDVCVVGFY